jgi:hypothetical protein
MFRHTFRPEDDISVGLNMMPRTLKSDGSKQLDRRQVHAVLKCGKMKVKTLEKNYPITGLDRTLGLQRVEALRISRQLAHESGKVSPAHRPPPPPPLHGPG